MSLVCKNWYLICDIMYNLLNIVKLFESLLAKYKPIYTKYI